MGKYFLMYHSYSERGIMGEGRLFKFNLNGTPIGEKALDFNCMSKEEVDILSVLVTNGQHIELGFNINEEFSKEVFSLSLPELVRKVNGMAGLLFMGNQNGKFGDDVCNQYLYAFKKGTLDKKQLV